MVQEKNPFILEQVASVLHAVRIDLENTAHNVVFILKQSPKCGEPVALAKYKHIIGGYIIHDLKMEFERCEQIYSHWGFDTVGEFSTIQRIQYDSVIQTCAETAKLLTEIRITNFVWTCFNVSKPKKITRNKWNIDELSPIDE